MNYILLQHPGHNRVYYNSADKLALAELKIACEKLSTTCSNLKIIEIENVRYISFETATELSGNDIQIISGLSFLFAIYKTMEVNNEICLIPVRKSDVEYLDNKISSLLKYPGKTNELFTKMMINVGLLTSCFTSTKNINVLDPVAGKGTTLFEGTIYGYNMYGIEIEQKPIHEASVFFKKYLETERIKHNSEKRQVYGKNKAEAINIQEFKYAKTKDEFKDSDTARKLGMICGNTQDASKYFKKDMFHLIVGDLPYGIAHGNSSAKNNSSLTRNPAELLKACLPGWHKVLKPGGVVVVAWNSFVAHKKALTEIFAAHGFEVMSEEPYNNFEHMVDKSIKRDIIVSRKKIVQQ